MASDKRVAEQHAELGYGERTDQLALWSDGDLFGPSSIVTPFSRRGKGDGGASGISLGITSFRWLLLCGDLLLITLAAVASAWIRFGQPVHTMEVYTIAWTVTMALYPPALYAFDLYNVDRSFRSWETAYRSAFA